MNISISASVYNNVSALVGTKKVLKILEQRKTSIGGSDLSPVINRSLENSITRQVYHYPPLQQSTVRDSSIFQT